MARPKNLRGGRKPLAVTHTQKMLDILAEKAEREAYAQDVRMALSDEAVAIAVAYMVSRPGTQKLFKVAATMDLAENPATKKIFESMAVYAAWERPDPERQAHAAYLRRQ